MCGEDDSDSDLRLDVPLEFLAGVVDELLLDLDDDLLLLGELGWSADWSDAETDLTVLFLLNRTFCGWSS